MKAFIILVGAGLLLTSCQPKTSTTITILTTTDLHGWVRSWDYTTDEEQPRYGLERVATVIDSIRADHPEALLIDAGDWLQGNPFAGYFAEVATDSKDYPLLRAADMLKYDAFVLGNHEFNYGIDYLNKRISQSRTPVISANIYHHGTDSTAYTPFILKEVDGFMVGVLGLTTPGVMVWDRTHVEGKLQVRDALADAKLWIPRMKAAGAEVIVVLAHTGYDGASSYHDETLGRENVGKAILDSIPDVDLLVFGHSHRVTQGDDHIQAGRWASHLGEARLHVRRTPTGDVVVDSIHTSTFEVETRSASEKVRNLVAAEHEEVRAYVNAPIVALAEAWTSEESRRLDTPIIDLIHHVQLKATGADLSAASAFNTSAQFAPPVLKRRDLSSLYPFQNTLYVLEITGKQLREYLEFTSRYYLVSTVKDSLVVNREWAGYNFDSIAGADYALDLRKEPGRRLTHLRVKGREVRNSDTFTLAVNSYRAEGGGGFTMLAGAPVSFTSTKSVRELMEEELRRVDTLRIADIHTRNWSLVY